MLRRKIIGVMLVYAVLLPTIAFKTASKIYEAPADVLAKIKEEGTKIADHADLGLLFRCDGRALPQAPA